jgi:hypothetical protein
LTTLRVPEAGRYNFHVNHPNFVHHADWSSRSANRRCATATLGEDGRFTAFGPKPVGELHHLLKNLRTEAGEAGTVLAGFDFPIGAPAHYATRAATGLWSIEGNVRHVIGYAWISEEAHD